MSNASVAKTSKAADGTQSNGVVPGASRGTRAKNFVLRSAMWLTGKYLRNRRISAGKRFLWDHVCSPHLSWRDIDFTCRTWFGATMVGRPGDFVDNRILHFGIWEPQITAVFTEMVKPGDVVLDVGANVGYYTLLSSALVGPAGRVYAVEPSARIRARLERNLGVNDTQNVTVLPFGAWHSNGEAKFHVAASRNTGASTLRALKPDETACVEQVPLRRLDGAIATGDIPRISLVKIDVEGAEFGALRGMTSLLERNDRLAIIVEFNPAMLRELGEAPQDLYEWLVAHGFSAQLLVNDYDVSAYLMTGLLEGPTMVTSCPDDSCYLLLTRRNAKG